MKRLLVAAFVLLLLLVSVLLLPRLQDRAEDPERAPSDSTLPDSSSAEPPVATSDEPYLKAVHWFGDAWAVNFWNTDLESRAEADFQRILDDGFNAVVFLVPWPGFAPDPAAGELDNDRVARLRAFMQLAHDMGLKSILRVSYAWDALDPGAAGRLSSLWRDEAHYAGWLDYLDSLWQAVEDQPGLQFGFFSWEDLWAVISLGHAEPEARLQAARDIGYDEWLARRYSLATLSERYGQSFSSHAQVMVPARREPAFALFLEFVNQAWIERFFLPAQQRFPLLSMEIRIDSDPIWDGEELVEWFHHYAAWDLPGAEWVTLYWSPAMGGENQGETLPPELAVERLSWWLDRVQEQAGPRQIFIGQFLVEDFTPGYENNGRIARDQVSEFLRLAAPVLADKTGGIGLWTWTDYGHDALPNPDFEAGLAGWSADAAVRVSDGVARLEPGDELATEIDRHAYHAPGGPEQAELCLTARSLEPGEASIDVRLPDLDEAAGFTLKFGPEFERRCRDYPVLDRMQVRLAALDDVALARVNSIGFVQQSGMRRQDFQDKPIAASYRDLVARLDRQPALLRPRYADGWMGRYMIDRLSLPSDGQALRIGTHLPEDWPLEVELTVTIDGELRARLPCRPGLVHDIPLSPNDSGSSQIRIEASSVHQFVGDARDLGCLLTEFEVVGDVG